MRRVEHAVGTAPADSAYVVSVDDVVLDVFLFAGEPAEILNQYTALTGRAGQPVLWAMGAWLQQASGEMPTQTVALLGRMRENQIPVDAVTLAQPAAWGFQADKTVFEWYAQRFPDAKRALLTAYSDTEAAIRAINEVGLLAIRHERALEPRDDDFFDPGYVKKWTDSIVRYRPGGVPGAVRVGAGPVPAAARRTPAGDGRPARRSPGRSR